MQEWDFHIFDKYLNASCWAGWVRERGRVGVKQLSKMAWVRFEAKTTEFRSDTRTDIATIPWAQIALRANFVQLLQFDPLFSVQFYIGYCLCQLPRLF